MNQSSSRFPNKSERESWNPKQCRVWLRVGHAKLYISICNSIPSFSLPRSDYNMDEIKNKKRKRKDELADDLIVEILSRLPAKSFVRFKSVSKAWLALASHPYYQKLLPASMSGIFLTTYSDHRRRQSHRYHSTSRTGVTDGNLSFVMPVDQFAILDCCNGLLLCRTNHDQLNSSYFVCNPATRKWALVPAVGSKQSFASLVLAFDHRLSPHYYILHFGRHPNLAYFYDDHCENELEVFSSETGVWLEVFSSETGEWMKTWAPLPRPVIVGFPPLTSAVYFNGSFHVLFYGKYISRIDISHKFKVDTQQFMLPDLPEVVVWHRRRLGKSGGYLHFAWHPEYIRHGARMRIWVLQDYNNHVWVLRHSVDLNAAIMNHRDSRISSLYYRVNARFDILAFHPDTEVVFLQVDKEILSYNWKNGTLTRAFNINFAPSYFHKWFFEYSPYLIEGSDL